MRLGVNFVLEQVEFDTKNPSLCLSTKVFNLKFKKKLFSPNKTFQSTSSSNCGRLGVNFVLQEQEQQERVSSSKPKSCYINKGPKYKAYEEKLH